MSIKDVKLKKPKVNKATDYLLEDSYNEDYFVNCIFNNNIDDNIVIESTIFDGCIFNNIDLSNTASELLDFYGLSSCKILNEVLSLI